MKIVLQRVTHASVTVDGQIVGEIGSGVLLLVGITHTDTTQHAQWLANKIANLRIFPALNGNSGFDRSLLDIGGQALVVSQFTLYAETAKGRRPDFMAAAKPEHAEPLIVYFADQLRSQGLTIAMGRFGAHMSVELANDGPVTIVLER
jgi:D-tyrosyl-tRNA(Tyr) deacylase